MGHESSWLSAVVMHHPSREHRLAELARTSAPLRLRVVSDPDPGGAPSPLRTAKVAWSAVAEGATHHLVLQDDVALPDGFARMLTEAIKHRPDAGIALYVNWNSPQNAYHARRAAALGTAWAPLSRWEYTPALGFVLPAATARGLGRYLCTLPDEVRDDDECITRFCRESGVQVFATVPNLVQHVDGPSLSGYDFHGLRRSVAFVGDAHAAVDWTVDPALDAALIQRVNEPRATEYVVDFIEGRCAIRFLRPSFPEPVDHPYSWHWFDWCPLAGVDPHAVVDGFHGWRTSAGFPAERLLLEAWAAGFLLGADAATSLATDAKVDPDAVTMTLAARSWAQSSLGRNAWPARVADVATACLEGLRHSAPVRSYA